MKKNMFLFWTYMTKNVLVLFRYHIVLKISVWVPYQKWLKVHNTWRLWRHIPCSLSRSDLFLSTSGLSAFSTWLRHWLCRLLRVTVKLTNVTREQMSGGNSTYKQIVKFMILLINDMIILIFCFVWQYN